MMTSPTTWPSFRGSVRTAIGSQGACCMSKYLATAIAAATLFFPSASDIEVEKHASHFYLMESVLGAHRRPL